MGGREGRGRDSGENLLGVGLREGGKREASEGEPIEREQKEGTQATKDETSEGEVGG